MRVAEGLTSEVALRWAAAVERVSEHPVARAIVASAAERSLEVPPAEDFRALPGRGVEARVLGRTLRVGGPNLLRKLGVEPVAADARLRVAEWRAEGRSVLPARCAM